MNGFMKSQKTKQKKLLKLPTIKPWHSLVVLLLLGAVLIPKAFGAASPVTYYVSLTGNDSNSGTSQTNAWKTISKVNTINFQPGDKILFEGGQTFPGNLYLDASDVGTATLPITISSYGSGRAIINGGNGNGLFAYNSVGYNINNVNFAGSGATSNTANGINFYTDLPGDVKLDTVIINNVETSGFGGAGILLGSWNNLTGYKDVSITNVSSHNNGRTGISTYAQGFPAHQNVYVGYSSGYSNLGVIGATSNTGSGITLGSVDGGTIEYSSAYGNGQNCTANGCGVGIWTYDSNNVKIQYNESYNNKTGNKIDGDGFDLDQNVSNSTVQYNYSHGNYGAGYLLAQSPNNTNHTGNTIRYNISENDARKNPAYGAIQLYGKILNANIYNNTVYITPNSSGKPSAIVMSNWGIESEDVSGINVRNNIFQTTSSDPMITITSGQLNGATNLKFQQNDYYPTGSSFKIIWGGTTYTSLSAWQTATNQEKNGTTKTGSTSNPLLTSPGKGGTIGNPANLVNLSAYKLKSSSPMINTALDLNTFGISPGAQDFYKISTPRGGGYDVGANEFPLPIFTVTGYASPTTATVGTNISLSATFTSNVNSTDLIDMEVYGAQGRVFQYYKDNDVYTANTPKTYTKTWSTTGLPAGTYSYYEGVWTPGWAKLIAWKYIGSVTLQ